MAKYILSLVLSLSAMTSIFAQRLIKGQKGFEGTIGIVSDKKPYHDYFYIQAGFTVNGKNGSYQFYGLEYSQKKHGFDSYSIPVETFTGEGGYSFPLLRDWGKNISLNLGFTAIAGYEIFNHGETALSNGAIIQNKDSFIYGASVRLSIETYISDHLLVLIQGKAKGIWGTSVENFRPASGIGLRYIF